MEMSKSLAERRTELFQKLIELERNLDNSVTPKEKAEKIKACLECNKELIEVLHDIRMQMEKEQVDA